MKWLYLSAAALLSVALAGAQSLTGRWTGNFSTADNGLEIVVALNQAADGTVTGYILSPRSTDTITSGKAEGNSVTLEAERAGRGGAIQKVTYTASVEGGKMKLTLPAPQGRGPGRGAPGSAPGTPGPGGPPPGGPGGGRGGQPQVVELARVSTDVPKPLPPRPAPVSLPMPTTAVKYNGQAKTPPMGWNSWNKFRNRVSDKMVREMADAIAKSGMSDAGYVYVNIDDTWQGTRDADGNISTNKKFPDMKALSAYVHGMGMKLGIYSSPGPKTCAGYEGSYQHEQQDAKTYAAWGIDYLKYDWCSASRVYEITQPHGRRLREDGTCAGQFRPHDRLQPVPVRQAGCRRVGRESRRKSVAHHRRHQRPLGFHGEHRFQHSSPAARSSPVPDIGTTPTCWKSATAA